MSAVILLLYLIETIAAFCCDMLEISRDIHVPISYLYSLCTIAFESIQHIHRNSWSIPLYSRVSIVITSTYHTVPYCYQWSPPWLSGPTMFPSRCRHPEGLGALIGWRFLRLYRFPMRSSSEEDNNQLFFFFFFFYPPFSLPPSISISLFLLVFPFGSGLGALNC